MATIKRRSQRTTKRSKDGSPGYHTLHDPRRSADAAIGATVEFEFEEIFLFAMFPDHLTVLAPAKEHTTRFEGPNIPRMKLDNHLITLLKDGVPGNGTLTRNTGAYMVDLDDVLGPGMYSLRPDLGSDLVAARFELGGDDCVIEDRQAVPEGSDPSYVFLKWAFGAHFTHRLTNRTKFILNAGNEIARYKLQIENLSNNDTMLLDLHDGDVFTARTSDGPKPPIKLTRRTLREFALLYELMADPDGAPVLGPIPTDPRPPQVEKRFARRARGFRGEQQPCLDPLCPNGGGNFD